VKLDTARCAEAAVDLKKDPWSVPALGDHALCLIDMGSSNEANTKLDQLAAFAPEDWRVALGRAELARQKGDASNAEIGYRAAAMLAPDAEIRAAIAAKYPQPAGS
jgi:Flp pilus assembly protein TadD